MRGIHEISAETIKDELGTLASLTTTEKGSLVGAINEIDTNADAANTAIGALADYQGDRDTSVVAALNEQMILRVHDKWDGAAFNAADMNSLAAIHGVEVYGSDPTMPHQVWRIYRNHDPQGYRVIIARRDGAAWERVIDTNSMPGVVTENTEGITAVVVPAACNVLGTVPTAWAKLWIDYAKVCTPGYDYCSLDDGGGVPIEPPYVIKAKNVFASTDALNTLDDSTYAAAINEVLEDIDNTVDMWRMGKYEALYAGTTYKRGIVSLRFDDGRDDDYDVVYPLLAARNLVGGFAVSEAKLDEADYMTTAEALELQMHGNEIMCHSRNHGADPAGYTAFLDETATAADDLRTAGFCINQFIQPGTWTGTYNFTTEEQLLSREGRLIRNNFAAMSAYMATPESYEMSNHFGLPRRYRYGQANHSAYAASLATLEDYVDKVSQYGLGYTALFHPSNFDTADNITTADFTSFLDYVETARDAGLIDVMTPTAQYYATKSPTKVNLIDDGDFELSATGAWVFWQIIAGAPTVEAAAGITGNAAKVNSTAYIQQYIGGKNLRSLAIDCWAKSATGDAATARVLVRDSTGTELIKAVETAVAGTWTHIFFTVGVRPAMAYVRVALLNNGSGPDVLFDNVQVYKT